MASSNPRNLILKVVLDGLYDEDCPLSRLRGCYHILKAIWAEVRQYWEAAIKLPDEDREFDNPCWGDHVMQSVRSPASRTYAAPVSCIEDYCTYPDFPEPSGININMMPFLVGETFEECKLPEYVRPYWDLIQLCLDPHSERQTHHLWNKTKYPSDLGRVYYLTIQETEVPPGQAQRRPGLHVDSPGSVKLRQGEAAVWGGALARGAGTSAQYTGHRWGAGCCHVLGADKPVMDFWDVVENNQLYVTFGGIYLATNLPGSCRVWNCGVAPEAVGPLGDIEHLRWALPGPGQLLRPGQLYWVTDRTPHESLPLQEAATRQFFRVVTAEVSLWYRDHSTASPLGVLPDPALTRIVAGDKFSEAGLQLVTGWEEAASEQMEEERRKLKLWNQARCDFHKSYPGSKECDVCKKRFQFMKDV